MLDVKSFFSKLKTKIIVAASSITVLALITFLIFAKEFAVSTLEKHLLKNIQEKSLRISTEIQSEINEQFQTLRTLAAHIESSYKANLLSRQEVNFFLREFLSKQPKIFGVWLIWEPNAFDNNDDYWKDEFCHNSTGRFNPWWYRDKEGNLNCDTAYLEDDPRSETFYHIPLKENREMLVEPYVDPVDVNDPTDDTLMTSLTTTLHNKKGESVGVAGIDITLSHLSELLRRQIDEDNTQTFYWIFTENKQLLATTAPEHLKNIPLNELKPILQQTNTKPQISTHLRHNMPYVQIAFPITFRFAKEKWYFVCRVEEAHITQQSKILIRIALGLAIIFIILGGIFLVKISESIILSLKSSIHILNTSIEYQGTIEKSLEKSVHSIHSNIQNIKDELEDSQAITQGIRTSIEATEQSLKNIQETTQNLLCVSHEGSAVTQELSYSSEALSQAVHNLSSIENLFLEISNRLSIIQKIASTNHLLSLNASIEAARAGEHGLRFTIVAEEINNLAKESEEAATAIGKLLSESHKFLRDIILSVQNSNKTSLEVVKKVVEKFERMHEHSQKIAEHLELLEQSNQQESEQISSILSKIEQLYSIAQSLVEQAEKLEQSANALQKSRKQVQEATQAIQSHV